MYSLSYVHKLSFFQVRKSGILTFPKMPQVQQHATREKPPHTIADECFIMIYNVPKI